MPPCQPFPGTGGGHGQLGARAPSRTGSLPYVSRQDSGPPTPRVLGGTEPYSREMEKYQRHSLSGVRAPDTGEHGPSSYTYTDSFMDGAGAHPPLLLHTLILPVTLCMFCTTYYVFLEVHLILW